MLAATAIAEEFSTGRKRSALRRRMFILIHPKVRFDRCAIE